jgi:hypothetical protein
MKSMDRSASYRARRAWVWLGGRSIAIGHPFPDGLEILRQGSAPHALRPSSGLVPAIPGQRRRRSDTQQILSSGWHRSFGFRDPPS